MVRKCMTNIDADELNGVGEHNIEANVTTLSGNAMSRYEPNPLEQDGILVNKKGKDNRKQMDEYYAWMDAAGIKLQNIIDQELGKSKGSSISVTSLPICS